MATHEVEIRPPVSEDLERAAAFSQFRKCYHLTIPNDSTGADELQRLFHPFVVGWLALHSGWSIESNGSDIVAWKTGTRCVGVKRLKMLDQLGELLTLFTAADVAAEQAGQVQVELRSHDRISSLVTSGQHSWSGLFARNGRCALRNR